MHTLDASTGFIHNGLAGVIAGWIVEDVPDEVNFRLEMGGGHQEAKAKEGSRLRGAGVRAPRQQTARLLSLVPVVQLGCCTPRPPGLRGRGQPGKTRGEVA